MTKDYRLRKFGSKAAKVLLAGAMVSAFAPGMAFAHYAPETNSGLQLADQNDQDEYGHGDVVEITKAADVGAGAKFSKGVADANTYVYKGYAHSDGAHYAMYSLYTELITDGKGTLTGINLTSGIDTFAGIWGTYSGHTAGWAVYGYLPDGVSFDAPQSTDANGTTSVLPTLKGAEKLGSSIQGIYLYNVQADGTTVGSDVENRGTKTHQDYDAAPAIAGEDTASYAYDAATGRITIKNGAYNLIKVTYKIGYEIPFDTYIIVNDNEYADAYVDALKKTDYSVPTELQGTATTDRDRWTGILLTLIKQRQLASWSSTLQDDSLYTGKNDGELGDLDTISGATKTSDPFVKALNEAVKSGYVKSVAENVTATIDNEAIDVVANPKDASTVTLNADGQYVLSNIFPKGDTLKRNDQHGVTLTKISVYDLSDQTIGAYGMNALAKGNSGIGALAEYTPQVTSGRSKTWVDASAAKAGEYATAVDDDNIKFEYEISNSPLILTLKNKNVTHVVFTYELGHSSIAIAYDLAQTKAAGDVIAQIDAINSAAKATAARKAYNALSTDVRGMVGNVSKLIAAEKKYAQQTQTIKVSPASKTYALKKVKKAKQTLTVKVSGAKTALTVTPDAKAKKAKITAKASGKTKVKVTVPKKTKKGTYKIKVAAKKSSSYKASSAKTITIKVK